MRRYCIFHIPVMSFFSKSLYRDVAFRWKGTGFAYLLLLLAVCWLFGMVKIQAGLANFVDNEAPAVISQVPTIRITNGEASIDEPQPYPIKDPKSGEILVLIDTTGSINSLDQTEALVLVTKTELIARKSDVETRTFSFAGVENLTLNQQIIEGWLNIAKTFLVAMIYPFVVLGSFMFRIVQALIYAALGILFAKWRKVELPYGALLRLSVTAVTPAIIAKTLLGVGGVHLPFAGLWYFLAAMGYLLFGVTACAQAEPRMPHAGFVARDGTIQQWNTGSDWTRRPGDNP